MRDKWHADFPNLLSRLDQRQRAAALCPGNRLCKPAQATTARSSVRIREQYQHRGHSRVAAGSPSDHDIATAGAAFWHAQHSLPERLTAIFTHELGARDQRI